MLDGELAVLQASMLDSLTLGTFSLFEDGIGASANHKDCSMPHEADNRPLKPGKTCNYSIVSVSLTAICVGSTWPRFWTHRLR